MTSAPSPRARRAVPSVMPVLPPITMTGCPDSSGPGREQGWLRWSWFLLWWCRRLVTASSDVAIPGKKCVDVGGELGVVLEQEPVRRVGVDLDLCVRDQAGEQGGEVGQDHRVAVAVGHEHRHADGAEPLQ